MIGPVFYKVASIFSDEETLQSVLCPRVLIFRLVAGIYDKFAKALSDAINNLKVGDGFTEGVVQVISCTRPFTPYHGAHHSCFTESWSPSVTSSVIITEAMSIADKFLLVSCCKIVLSLLYNICYSETSLVPLYISSLGAWLLEQWVLLSDTNFFGIHSCRDLL